MHNDELHSLYSSPNIIRVRWVEQVLLMGEMRNAHTILVGNPKETVWEI
jgi:hypothetical protein